MLQRKFWCSLGGLSGLVLLGSAVAAQPQYLLHVHNAGPTLFQYVAETRLPDLPAAVSVCETNAAGQPKQAVPAQVEGERLLFLLPGLTETGATRYFAVTEGQTSESRSPGSGQREARIETDLQIAETEEAIRVRNTYFTLTHPKRGHGGFPTFVRFNLSGTEETRFVFEDRLFERGEGYFTLRADPESSARVVSAGPLEAVVETQARYYSGQPARGNARATYRWVYRAFSPVVNVTMHAEREDDFAWRELHFLQISRKDNELDRWAGGEPLQTGRFTDARKGYALPRWAVMYNRDDAVGLAFEGTISLFDGISEYYNYVQFTTGPWRERTFEHSARVYWGPAREPAEYATWLTARPAVTVAVQKPPPSPPPPSLPRLRGRYALYGEHLTLRFASQREGLGLVSLKHAPSGHEWLYPSKAPPTLWRLVFRARGLAKQKELTLDNTAPSERHFLRQRTPDTATAELRWRGLSLGEGLGTADVRVTVEVRRGDPVSHWRIFVATHSEEYGLWEVQFPLLTGLSQPGQSEVAVPRSNWGYLYRHLRSAQAGNYPSANWPMQFLLINEGEEGLYLAAHDPRAYPKRFRYQPGGEFAFFVPVPNMGLPGTGYEGDVPIAVGVYAGDWWVGAKMYRRWATTQTPWTRLGPLARRKDYPPQLKHLCLWMLGGGFAREVVPNMRQAQEFFALPLGIHWYNWHQIPFDDHYPEYFPTKPGFAEGVRELAQRGMVVMPYINARLMDSRTETWQRDDAFRFCALNEKGEKRIEVYGSKVPLTPMCPATKYWQDKINEIVGRLLRECGVNAVYLDQIAAAGPALCFNPEHGHPLGGGSYWVDGYRELLRRVQEQGAAVSPDVFFTTENNAEPYMDGVDAFLIWNPRHEAEIPLMTAVYSGYTTYFSSPVTRGTGDLSFCMAQGRDFVWGCQLGWMGFDLLRPEHRVKAEYLRTLGQYRAVAAKFLVEGELLGELKPREPVPQVHGRWNKWGGGTWPANLPAVLGTVWRAPEGTIGLVLTNVSDEPQMFTFPLPSPRKRGTEGDALLLVRCLTPQGSMPTGLGKKEAVRTEVLLPREVVMLEVEPVTSHRQILEEMAACLARLKVPLSPASRAQPPEVDALWRDLQNYRQQVEARPQVRAETKRLLARAGECLAQIKAGQLPLIWELERRQCILAAGETAFWPLRLQNRQQVRQKVRLRLAEGAPVEITLQPQEQKVVPLSWRAPAALEAGPERHLLRGLMEFDGYQAPWTVGAQVLPPFTADLTVEPPPRAGESSLLRVTVHNNTSRSASPRLWLEVPAEWRVEPGRRVEVPTLPPHAERTLLFRCEVPQDAEVGRARVAVNFLQEAVHETVEVAPPRPQTQARRFPSPPKIDGDLAEWQGPEPLTLGMKAAPHLEGWTGPADCSAQVWTGWDEGNFYLAAEVTDNAFVQPHQHREMWRGDCLQLAFRPTRRSEPGYDREVVEFGLALTPNGPEVWEWLPQERTVTEARLRVRQWERGLAYEVAIPWAAFGNVRPVPGGRLTWSVTVNDDDGEGFRGWLEWTPGICGGKDASAFGWLHLAAR
ncbi:MAG TPA: hypothetical protein EYP85_05355 [Armatimonadetes bacterium]|nr:hypothetical protein [Armatimonadota bacterium]